MTRIGFPWRLDAAGRTAVVADDDVRGLVEQVLFTRPGERVNRPEFGSGVDTLVFAPGDDALAASMQGLVAAALQRWLGDLIRLEGVTVTSREATLEVVVEYLPLAGAAVARADTRSPGGAGRRRVVVTGGTP